MPTPRQNDVGARTISVGLQEAARITGLSRRSLYNCASRGELPLRKVGAKTLVLVDDLHLLITGEAAV
ncbi:helix-turn-helix domain-containing protein [Novosphingobium barchaimii]|nr:helix-turn-helix domain-containing protein [Novosphingobium barchaimii]